MVTPKWGIIGWTVFVALFVAAQAAWAASYSWTNGLGGDFNTAGNWSPSGPPGPADDALFNTTTTYRVTWSDSLTNKLLYVRNGTLTLDTGASTYVATNAWLNYNNSDRANVFLTNGVVETRDVVYVGSMGHGDLTISNGAVWRHTGQGSASAFFNICNHMSTTIPRTNIVTVTGSNSLLSVGNRFYLGPYSFATNHLGALRIRDGGRVDLLNTINHLSNHAEVDIDGTNSILECKASGGNINFRFGTSADPASLSITRGGKLGTYNVSVGGSSDFPTYATVLIDGPGSELYTTNSYIAFGGGASGPMTKGGSVNVTISNGGRAATPGDGGGNMFNWSNSVLTLANGHLYSRYFYNNGLVRGDGTIYCGTKCGSAGILSPGSAGIAGRIILTNIVGGFEMFMKTASYGGITNGGTVEFDIGGTNPVSQYDVLAVVGSVILTNGAAATGSVHNATITARMMNGFQPQNGDTFDLLTATGNIIPADLTNVAFNMPVARAGTTWSAAVTNITGGKALRLTAYVPPWGTLILLK